MRIHWPYALAEAFYAVSQLAWAVLFAANGLALPAIGAGFLAACVVYVGVFYGDHAGKVFFVLDRSRLRLVRPAQSDRPGHTAAARSLTRNRVTHDTR